MITIAYIFILFIILAASFMFCFVLLLNKNKIIGVIILFLG